MVAAAFTGTILLQPTKGGSPLYYRVTISDVAAAYWIFPDGSNTLQMPGDQAYWIRDIILITGGTDTTNTEIFSNQKSTGIYLDHKSSLNTVQNRMLTYAPILVKPGSQLKFIQRA